MLKAGVSVFEGVCFVLCLLLCFVFFFFFGGGGGLRASSQVWVGGGSFGSVVGAQAPDVRVPVILEFPEGTPLNPTP